MREIRSAFVPDEITPIHVAAKPEPQTRVGLVTTRPHRVKLTLNLIEISEIVLESYLAHAGS